jgi:hypothetical protein
MTFPLIGPEQDFVLWAILIAAAAFGFWCERFPWGRKYSGVMWLMAIALAFTLAALGKLAAEKIGTPQFAIIITTALT